jgi:hypothetical protein
LKLVIQDKLANVMVPSRARREKLGFDWAGVPGNLEIMFGPFWHFTGGPSFFFFFSFFFFLFLFSQFQFK